MYYFSHFVALLTFTDGKLIGAILDRNGLRPSRYYLTKDNHMVMASEVGVLDIEHSNVVHKVIRFLSYIQFLPYFCFDFHHATFELKLKHLFSYTYTH